MSGCGSWLYSFRCVLCRGRGTSEREEADVKDTEAREEEDEEEEEQRKREGG